MRLHGLFLIGLLAINALVQAQEAPVELDSDRVPKFVTKGDCFFKNGTLLTVAQGVIENGSILIRGGKIVAIGKNLTPPAGIPVFDATGKILTPGLLDAHSHTAVDDDVNEGSESLSSEVRIHDILDPQSSGIYRGLSNGVTTSLILHGSANPIGGQSVVIKMKWKHPAEDLPIPDAPRMIKFALGENVKRSFGGNQTRFPATRMGVEAVYRRAFNEARHYMQTWDAYEKAHVSDPNVIPPRRDLRLETLADLLRGKIWVQCHSYRQDEMLMMLRLSKDYGFKIGAMQHALEAYKLAPELAAAHVGISCFADFWAYKVEVQDAIPYNMALCTRAGVVVSVNSDNFDGGYRLQLEAAKSMHYGGLDENQALRLVTINPAIELGIEKRVGSLEVGKDADIAVWEGHPLSVYSRCILTMIEGETLFQRRDVFGLDKTAVLKNRLDATAPVEPFALPVPPTTRAYAIVGATVHPVTEPDISEGMIVFADGKITAVGKKVAIPKGAFVINGRGLHVYPGLIDAGTTLGLSEIGSVRASIDSNDIGEFQPDLLALTAVNPASDHFAVTRVNGITATQTHPNGGLISGQSALIELAGWTPELMKIQSPTALYVNFPEGIGDLSEETLAFFPPDFVEKRKESEKSDLKKLQDVFDLAKRYAAAHAQSSSTVTPDLKLEAMVPYVTGKKTVVFSVNSAHGIRSAIKFAEKNNLKIVLSGVSDAWRVTDLLAQKKIPVLLTASYASPSTGSSSESYAPIDTVYSTPALLNRAGVKFAFQTESESSSRNLPFHAGVACAYGLPRAAALKAVTLNAAEILDVADQMGSLEPGKLANVLLTDGDPLEITTNLHALFIAGKPVSLESKHTRLYQLYRQRLPGRN